MRRVDQLLSALGYCSRKEARALCADGRVELDGAALTDASERVDGTRVTLDGEPLEFPDGLLVLFHKPAGVVCTHDSREGQRVYDLLPPRWQQRDPKVTTVGRLDKETSGLLVVTDQGALVQRMTSPKHHVEKTYVATLDADVPASLVDVFARGIELREGNETERTEPAVLRINSAREAEVTVKEGRYHQVRRMFAAQGLHVVTLHRTRFGPWRLDASLAPGEWRALELSETDVASR
ncbi:MAG: rRNA pseudouridine synthase [Archangium sp.]|nr:rRNA pseudouridine synthase [Archangium sp.]